MCRDAWIYEKRIAEPSAVRRIVDDPSGKRPRFVRREIIIASLPASVRRS